MDLISLRRQHFIQPPEAVEIAPDWVAKVAFASITGLPDNRDLVSRQWPAIAGTVTRTPSQKGAASTTGSVSSGLVWSTLKPIPNIFPSGMSFLMFAKPTPGGTLQRAFFLGDEVQIPSNQYNQSTLVFNSTKAGVASSGLFTCFEYNFGFQGAAQSTAGAVDGNWHVFIGTRSPGYGTWTLYRDGLDVTAGSPTFANAIALNDGCRLHVHPGAVQGYTGELALGVAFRTLLDVTEVRSLSNNPWQIFRAAARRIWYEPAGIAPGGFQAAWAHSSNVILGAGI